MLIWHFSSLYLGVLCSTDQHDFTFIKEIRCNTNAWCENFNFLMFRNIYSIDVKIAKNALRLMETASFAHPCALSDIVATVPYKENCCVYLFSMESPITKIIMGMISGHAHVYSSKVNLHKVLCSRFSVERNKHFFFDIILRKT